MTVFMRQKDEGKKMTVVGSGNQRRDYTHVNDVVLANMLAAKCTNSETLGTIFNIGTGTNHSVLDLVELLDGDCEFVPARPGEAKMTLADNTRAREILEWEPRVKLEDYIGGLYFSNAS